MSLDIKVIYSEKSWGYAVVINGKHFATEQDPTELITCICSSIENQSIEKINFTKEYIE